jgi:hypothetical protein
MSVSYAFNRYNDSKTQESTRFNVSSWQNMLNGLKENMNRPTGRDKNGLLDSFRSEPTGRGFATDSGTIEMEITKLPRKDCLMEDRTRSIHPSVFTRTSVQGEDRSP